MTLASPARLGAAAAPECTLIRAARRRIGRPQERPAPCGHTPSRQHRRTRPKLFPYNMLSNPLRKVCAAERVVAPGRPSPRRGSAGSVADTGSETRPFPAAPCRWLPRPAPGNGLVRTPGSRRTLLTTRDLRSEGSGRSPAADAFAADARAIRRARDRSGRGASRRGRIGAA